MYKPAHQLQAFQQPSLDPAQLTTIIDAVSNANPLAMLKNIVKCSESMLIQTTIPVLVTRSLFFRVYQIFLLLFACL